MLFNLEIAKAKNESTIKTCFENIIVDKNFVATVKMQNVVATSNGRTHTFDEMED
jgi:hypothetical protein